MALVQITNKKRFYTILLALLVILLGGYRLVFGSGTIQKTGDIEVKSGSSAASIGKLLKEQEYISSSLGWRLAVWRAGSSKPLQAGIYHVEKDESLHEFITGLQTGDVTPSELTITYPEGFTIEQIAARTAGKGIGTPAEFIAAAKVGNFSNQFDFLKGLSANHSLEGYLFPDTYRVFPDDTPTDVIRRMLTNFDKKVTQDLRQEATQNNRTLDQVVTMASIIEREVNRSSDLAPVADVLWKRFDADTGLGVDASVRYTLNKWDSPLTVQDLAIDSPYNTRKYKGLPPTAIGNPGLSVIIAALRPEKNDYYYYLSTPEGETIFSKNLDEHNRNKAKYLR